MSLQSARVSDALNSTWRINVSGQVYGPYTGHQLKAFVSEGRIAPHSIVQVGEQGPWITAIDDPVLGQLFVRQQPPAAKALTEPRGEAQTAAGADAAAANFVIIADLR